MGKSYRRSSTSTKGKFEARNTRRRPQSIRRRCTRRRTPPGTRTIGPMPRENLEYQEEEEEEEYHAKEFAEEDTRPNSTYRRILRPKRQSMRRRLSISRSKMR